MAVEVLKGYMQHLETQEGDEEEEEEEYMDGEEGEEDGAAQNPNATAAGKNR